MNISLDTVISLVGVACFGLLMLPIALRWRMKEKATLALSLYLALGLVWNIGVVTIDLELVTEPTQHLFFEWLAAISRGMMPLVFGALTLAFLGRTKALYWYWAFGSIILVLWVAISLNIYNVANIILGYLPTIPNVETAISSLEIVTWGAATIVALWALYVSFRQYPQAQYRNRFRYWFVGTLVLSLANILILSRLPAILSIGSTLNIMGALLVTYIVMRYHPPDLRIIVNRILQTITVTLTLAVILFGAFNTAYLMNDWQIDPQSILLWLMAMSLIGGFVLPSLSRWIEKTLSNVLFGAGIDETTTLTAYSQQVSSDWDFAKLSKQALDFILQEMGIEKGGIFVDEGDASGRVNLKMVVAARMPEAETGYFFSNDPWIMHMRRRQTPVTQYDLDILPVYKDMDKTCKEWLLKMEAEIFIPLILRGRELIGILALGPKPYHRPYTAQDLARLRILTSQIALDLDKAKLFGQLGAVNLKLGELSRKFESFDKGKTDFLSIASHELRTPLTHIHGYASMLMEATEDELQNPAYLQHVFDGIAKGSSRLKSVVDLIFDVSRADIGELQVARNAVSLAEVVNEAVEDQKGAIEQRGHKLIVSGLDQLPMIDGDMTRLVQSINHLLNNAIKYTPDGGTITITGRNIVENGETVKVELIITDTGIGINPEDHARIFEKFYRVGDVQLHSTGNVKFKGAGPGLGLPLVGGIIKAHGGEVWVESPEYNEKTCPGSQFHVVLPVKASELEEKPAKPAPSMIETRHWRSGDLRAIKQQVAQQQKKKGNLGPKDESL
jgi:signal transduction histidine kinase